jgi:hypothetical protein
MMHDVHVTTALFFVLLASSFLYVLLLIPRLLQEIRGMDLAWGFLFRVPPDCVCRARFAAIDAPAAIIDIAGRVSAVGSVAQARDAA